MSELNNNNPLSFDVDYTGGPLTTVGDMSAFILNLSQEECEQHHWRASQIARSCASRLYSLARSILIDIRHRLNIHFPFLLNRFPRFGRLMPGCWLRIRVPDVVAELIVTDRMLATILFTDIVGSTEQAVELGDRHWNDLLDRHDAVLQEIIGRFRGKLVKTTGDGGLATFDGPTRAIGAAREIARELATLRLAIRAGLHTGECELRGEDIGGIAVHIASRIAGLATGGELLVSRTVKDLVVGSGIAFGDRGMHKLKGVPDDWHVFSVMK